MKKSSILSLLLTLLLALVYVIPANAAEEVQYENLTLDQQQDYLSLESQGYTVTITKGEGDALVISGSKKHTQSGIQPRSEIENMTYDVYHYFYLGEYNVGRSQGTVSASINITNNIVNMTAHNLTIYSNGTGLLCTYTTPTYTVENGSGWSRYVQKFTGTVQQPSGGLLSGQNFPMTIYYKVTASTGALTIS